jgi:hypothetical protein
MRCRSGARDHEFPIALRVRPAGLSAVPPAGHPGVSWSAQVPGAPVHALAWLTGRSNRGLRTQLRQYPVIVRHSPIKNGVVRRTIARQSHAGVIPVDEPRLEAPDRMQTIPFGLRRSPCGNSPGRPTWRASRRGPVRRPAGARAGVVTVAERRLPLKAVSAPRSDSMSRQRRGCWQRKKDMP